MRKIENNSINTITFSLYIFSIEMVTEELRDPEINANNYTAAARGSCESYKRRDSHLSRILILFSILLIASFLFIIIAIGRKKELESEDDVPTFNNDLYTPPTMLA